MHDDRLAEDAVQEAFLSIARNFQKVGEINCPQIKNFLVIIVRNVSFTMSKKKLDAEDLDDLDKLSGNVRINDSTYEHFEYKLMVEAVMSLPVLQRDSLYMYTVYAYKPSEIANLLGISTEAVNKRIQRGRKMLIEILEKGESDLDG